MAARNAAVPILLDGANRLFSPILLRDLCQCSQCVDPSTNQKYRPTTDIPASIQPESIEQSDSGITIRWQNDVPGYGEDHLTNIPTNILRQYVHGGVTGIAHNTDFLEPRTLCDAAEYSRLPDVSYDEYMSSDSALYRVLQQLRTHGLAFVTGVPESEKSVSTVAERIGPVKNTFYGYTWDVRSVPEAKNVAYTSQDLGFHMDLLYMEQPPHLQLLHCIRSSSTGGASLFTDSFRSASDLLQSDDEAFGKLASRHVNFHYNHPSSALYHQARKTLEFDESMHTGGTLRGLQLYRRFLKQGAQVYRKDFGHRMPIDQLEAVSWSPPFQGPFGRKQDPDKASRLEQTNKELLQWHSAAQKFSQLIHRPEMIHERLMKPGECVLFDNRRVLHARKAFEVGDVGKERWLRGAYLDKDPYLSKLRVLHAQLGKGLGEGGRMNEDYFQAAEASG